MKLVYLSSSTIPSKAANSVHVMRMCQAFAKSGHNVTLLCTEGGGGTASVFSDYGVNSSFDIAYIYKPKIRVVGGVIYALMSWMYLRGSKGIDFLYGRHLASLFLASRFGLPMAYEAHQVPGNPWQQFMLKWLFRSSNFRGLVVISEALKNLYLSRFPSLLEEKVFCFHDGADPLPDKTEKIVSRLSSNDGTLKVGYIGSLYRGRGIELIIYLAQAFPDISFELIGGTSKQVNEYLAQGVPENLVFLGFKSNKDVREKYYEYDVLLAPYQRQVSVAGGKGDTSAYMSPLKIFEYMAAGKAIICSDHKVIQEVLHHRYNSFLCSPDDWEEWKDALDELVKNKAIREKIGDQARKNFMDHYTWENRAQAILKALAI